MAMTGPQGIADRVLESLVGAGLLTREQVAHALEAARERGVTAGRVLAERGLVSQGDIASVLEHEMGIPRVDLSSYAPEEAALALVPASVTRSRGVLPLFEIEGMLTVAIGDPFDVFMLDELAQLLGVEVEPVLAEPAEVRAAVAQYYGAAEEPSAPKGMVATEEAPPPPPVAEAPGQLEPTQGPEPAVRAADFFEEGVPEEEGPAIPVAPVGEEAAGAPQPAETIEEMVEAGQAAGRSVVDLDVLAVADPRKVALLVTEILEHAVKAGASAIHLLPYKDDFFVVFRTKGKLESVASAPVSLLDALVEGFRSFAHVPGSRVTPGLARVRTRIADKDLAITTSIVPTIAGQRVVVSLRPSDRAPRALSELGLSDAEVRALQAMVERGRGILLVCAPVTGGASTTYYALLAHAAAIGKTVYSVEASIEYEIPAVAQVMVDVSSPLPVANYLAAGLRQDTDVIAVDTMRSADDVHVAVEAAGKGKLVIATLPAADIASGVRRMLDLGVEPHSLAAALTLGLGQRLVRINCPNCTVEAPSDALARIPGATPEIVNKTGTGCPNCGKTGFRGAVGIFEVLPFTEPIRSSVARGATREDLAAAAAAAGMRPLAASGLARVKAGQVSADELVRVLRLA